MALQRIRDRMRNAHNLAIAEVDAQEVWQRAVFGIAVIGNEQHVVGSALDAALRTVEGLAEVIGVEREFITRSHALRETDVRYRF